MMQSKPKMGNIQKKRCIPLTDCYLKNPEKNHLKFEFIEINIVFRKKSLVGIFSPYQLWYQQDFPFRREFIHIQIDRQIHRQTFLFYFYQSLILCPFYARNLQAQRTPHMDNSYQYYQLITLKYSLLMLTNFKYFFRKRIG